MNYKLLEKKYINKVFLIIFLNIIVGFATMIPIIFMQRAIDKLLSHSFDLFLMSISLYVIIYIIVQILRTLVSERTHFLEIDIINSIRLKIVDKVLNTNSEYLEKQGRNFIHQKLMEDFSMLDGRVSNVLLELTLSLSSSIVGILIFAYYDIILLLILIPISFLATLIVNKTYDKTNSYSSMLQDSHSNLNKEFRYVITGGREIMIFCRNKFFYNKFKDISTDTVNIDKKNINLQTISQNIVGLSFNIMIGILILIGGFHIKDGELTIGALVAVIMYNSMVTDPIFNFIDNQRQLFNIKNAFNRINKLYNELEYNIDTNKVSLDDIKIENISIIYDDNIILKDFNFTINKGDCIRIFGKTGCGKSSIAKLFTGLYKPTSGKILINNSENNRCSISTVFQNNVLFDDTLENNVKLFNNIDENLFRKIISMTHSDEIFLKYKDDNIGEDGNKLSGGERTRIFIARALLYDADLYIFDEISTGLDEDIFQDIVKEIIKYLKGKTLIFIDHRELDEKYFNKSIFL